MQAGYFSTCWADIKNTPHWFAKLCLLALLQFIPIFGWIASIGYMTGWARDIAWNVHQPMPKQIFANEDGKMYWRGFFSVVLSIVYYAIPYIMMIIGYALVLPSYINMMSDPAGYVPSAAELPGSVASSALLTCSSVLILVLMMLWYVGVLRMSIYGDLGAGLQFKKIWAMARRDAGGLLRIFGMYLLVGLILTMILSAIIFVAIFLIIFIAIAMGSGSSASVDSVMAGASIGGMLLYLIILFFTLVVAQFLSLLMFRAMGYWMRQFDVAHWGGKNDPMPFETMPAQPAAQAAVAQPAPAQTMTSQTAPVQADTAAPTADNEVVYSQNPAEQLISVGAPVMPGQVSPAYVPEEDKAKFDDASDTKKADVNIASGRSVEAKPAPKWDNNDIK